MNIGDECPKCHNAVHEDETRHEGKPYVGCPNCGAGFDITDDRQIPPLAAAARLMASMEDPDEPSGIDWDKWKDQEKDREMGLR